MGSEQRSSTHDYATETPWTPPAGPDVTLVPAGRWWDAIKVPTFVGIPALDRLARTGAVIHDGFAARMYWFIPPGTGRAWDWPALQQVELHSTTTYVAVPAAHHTCPPGLHWHVPPTGGCLTDPAGLQRALREVVDTALGPRPATVDVLTRRTRQQRACR
ncbi:hypothetical protein [Streptomyces sp. NPDC018031]|uniref:hypothetical protein n=1 Tax=Streptomyces sp. NPDC018031 TaxID=3365033 RepID=UPI0037B996D0